MKKRKEKLDTVKLKTRYGTIVISGTETITNQVYNTEACGSKVTELPLPGGCWISPKPELTKR